MSRHCPMCTDENELFSISFSSVLLTLTGIFIYTLLFFYKPNGLVLPLYILAYLLLGGSVVLSALKSLINKDFFNENTLMTVATLGAFVLQDYTEAVGVMFFYKIGEFLQDLSVNQSRKNIQSLFQLTPTQILVKKEQTWVSTSPESIAIEEIILIRKGETIPLDGIVVNGESFIDTSSLTGESLPVNVTLESLVYSGTTNMGDSIEIRVTHLYKDSSIQKLMQLIEDSAAKKSPTEKFITKFAKKYTPVVFTIAILTFLIPVLLGYNWETWLERSIIFLVISCPCALVISVPLSFFSGLGVASKRGILIRSGEFLETLSHVKNIAFDKTGTLTQGELSIAEILTLQLSSQEALKIMTIVENHSSHPIANAFQKSYQSQYGNLEYKGSLKVIEIPGKGLQTQFHEKDILIGSKGFMESHSISFKDFPQPQIIGTQVYMAIDRVPTSIVVIADTLKNNAIDTIKKLQNKNIQLSILSGDNHPIVEKTAQQLGITNFYSNLLPKDKVDQIEKIKQTGITLFVGDGLNDAPSLKTADLGLAMGQKGSGLSIISADIVAMRDDIYSLVDGITIAEKTLVITKQNITLALSIKIGFMIMAIIGFSTVWEAVFADVGVAFLTILNTLRINK